MNCSSWPYRGVCQGGALYETVLKTVSYNCLRHPFDELFEQLFVQTVLSWPYRGVWVCTEMSRIFVFHASPERSERASTIQTVLQTVCYGLTGMYVRAEPSMKPFSETVCVIRFILPFHETVS